MHLIRFLAVFEECKTIGLVKGEKRYSEMKLQFNDLSVAVSILSGTWTETTPTVFFFYENLDQVEQCQILKARQPRICDPGKFTD